MWGGNGSKSSNLLANETLCQLSYDPIFRVYSHSVRPTTITMEQKEPLARPKKTGAPYRRFLSCARFAPASRCAPLTWAVAKKRIVGPRGLWNANKGVRDERIQVCLFRLRSAHHHRFEREWQAASMPDLLPEDCRPSSSGIGRDQTSVVGPARQPSAPRHAGNALAKTATREAGGMEAARDAGGLVAVVLRGGGGCFSLPGPNPENSPGDRIPKRSGQINSSQAIMRADTVRIPAGHAALQSPIANRKS